MNRTVAVSKRAQKRIQSLNQWVYKSDLIDASRADGSIANGDIVDVTDEDGRFLAQAYFSGLSQISLRVLTRRAQDAIDENFVRARLLAALDRRRKLIDLNKVAIVRLLNSEADFVPGLVVDKYGDYLVLQSLAAGAERFIDTALDFYEKETGCRGILIKNDAQVRKLEGLDMYCQWRGESASGPLRILSDGVHYIVDLAGGQKTGFFADQRRAYALLEGRVNGGALLDCFSYSGAFSMNAFKYGAKSSVIVDVSKEAVELARETAKLNGVYDKCEFVCANAFDYLKNESSKYKAASGNEPPFDFVVLDPPTFTKSKSHVGEALRGYKEIALRAARLVKNGGFILTCSCSFHITMSDFYDSQCAAFSDAGAVGYLAGAGFQDERDHPVISSMPESLYLKYFIFQMSK